MAQVGDTITYTYDDDFDNNSELKPEQEDITTVGQIKIEYLYGAGGQNGMATGGSGGAVSGTVVDVSNESTLYIWVGSHDGSLGTGEGRYKSTDSGDQISGGGSTELWFENTNQSDSSDEPFIAAAGGGGGGGGQVFSFGAGESIDTGGVGGARGGGAGTGSGSDGQVGGGISPPLGGDGGDAINGSYDNGGDGEGAVNTSLSEVIDVGTATTGGGSGAETNAEVRITYMAAPTVPVEVNGQEVTGIEVNGQEVTGIEVNGQEI